MRDLLLVAKKDGICTLTINRPKSQNRINLELMVRIYQEFHALKNDADVRVVILRGSGKEVFSEGIDLKGEINKGKAPGELPGDIAGYDVAIRNMMNSITEYPYPVIAMIYGRAFAAACDLAVCCDIRTAAATASLSMHPVRVGTAYQFEGIQRFVNVVGAAYTKELFFTASPVSAQKALQMGLVNYIFPVNELLGATTAIARNIADLPPLAVKGTKEIVTKLLRFQQSLTEKQQNELRAISAVARQSEDVKEAVKALFEGREPRYTGK